MDLGKLARVSDLGDPMKPAHVQRATCSMKNIFFIKITIALTYFLKIFKKNKNDNKTNCSG
ncbi:hypothetical protein SOASR015_05370 [Pectobacterium carotovorum subsp. carotovorum]|nr:hypothetical protein SOASR015_05370 [Pectobacterium carotovorum subsp. carotovorum]GLX54862.1 hypothetical protein Pcaca02_01710 [Pectobacterium carotovorum subsp. carotovorum]